MRSPMGGPMIRDLMNSRSSVRAFSGKKIPKEIIDDLIEAARLSPSGGNEQQYIFGIIESEEIRDGIIRCSYGQRWIGTAPLLIALCSKIKEDEKGGREIQKQRFPRYADEIDAMDKLLYTCLNLEEHQTKIPGTVIMLHALEYGIYSTWISRFDVLEVQRILNLPATIFPSEILALGYPQGEIKRLKKKGLDKVTFFNAYDSLAT